MTTSNIPDTVQQFLDENPPQQMTDELMDKICKVATKPIAEHIHEDFINYFYDEYLTSSRFNEEGGRKLNLIRLQLVETASVFPSAFLEEDDQPLDLKEFYHVISGYEKYYGLAPQINSEGEPEDPFNPGTYTSWSLLSAYDEFQNFIHERCVHYIQEGYAVTMDDYQRNMVGMIRVVYGYLAHLETYFKEQGLIAFTYSESLKPEYTLKGQLETLINIYYEMEID